MKAITLGTWQFQYNEASNTLRLFLNSGSVKDAALFTITPEGVYSWLEALSDSSTEAMQLMGQPMKAEYEMVMSMEDPYEVETVMEAVYNMWEDDLSKGFNGDVQEYMLTFEGRDREMLLASLFEEPALEHLTLQADLLEKK